MAGLVPAEADAERRARARATFVRNLRFACSEAQNYGVTVLIEPLNPRDMPNYLLSRQDDAHAIRTEVGAPNLKVQMDLYHAQIVEGDLSERIRRWLPHVGHIQIAGVPGRTPRARHRRDQLRVDLQAAGRVEVRRLGRLRISAAGEHGGRAHVALSAA
jgi:hydroxypyruvate isomerase